MASTTDDSLTQLMLGGALDYSPNYIYGDLGGQVQGGDLATRMLMEAGLARPGQMYKTPGLVGTAGEAEDDSPGTYVVSDGSHDQLIYDTSSWWEGIRQKYRLPQGDKYQGKKGEIVPSPVEQEAFFKVASDEDLKQYLKYDIQWKAYFGSSPFLVDSHDYGPDGRNWLDTSQVPKGNGNALPSDPNYVANALHTIDTLTPEDLKTARTAFPSSFDSRYQSRVKDVSSDIIGDIGMGLWKAGAAGVITGGVATGLGAVGAAVGGSLGSVIGSGAVTGAAGGAASGAILGGDPLKGAILGAAGGFVLKDMGLGKWALDKAKDTLGYSGNNPDDAVSLLAKNEGVPPGKIIEDGGKAVYGSDANIGDLASSGKVSLTDGNGVDITGDFNNQIATSGNDFAVDWDTGNVIPGGDSGLAEHVLGPGAVFGPNVGVSPETGATGGQIDVGSGNGTSGGGGAQGSNGMDVSDIAKLLGVGGNLYNWLTSDSTGDALKSASNQAAQQADPFSSHRTQYGDALDAFMQQGLTLPTAPNLTNPIDYAAQNPFTSISGLDTFLNTTQTPLDRLNANPFQSQSGYLDFLNYTPTPMEVAAANPFQSDSGLYDLLKNPDSITESPAYQFRLNQGLEALDRQLGAAGKRFSGNRMIALNDYAQGAASQEFENEYNRRADYYSKEAQQYQYDLSTYGQDYVNEAAARGAYQNQEFNQYSFDQNLYGQNYNNQGALLSQIYGQDQNQYNQNMSRYSQNYNSQWDIYNQNANRVLTQNQQQFNQLAMLSGANLNPNQGAAYGMQGTVYDYLANQGGTASGIRALGQLANIILGD